MSELKIAVYGAGGVGGYFGAVLARAGYPVSLIARGEHLKAIRRQSIRPGFWRQSVTHKHPVDRCIRQTPVDQA
jgi:ketopantoate reductase